MKFLLLLLLFPLMVMAQVSAPLINAYMEGQAGIFGFNGNVLVSKNGNIIYKRSFGYADYDARLALDDNTMFDCGSVTKEFTAMGILLLKDQGRISYADTLRKFFPELPYTNVTIQQLLTHTSGMPDGFELIEKHFDHSRIATNADLVRLLAEEKPPLLFKPGENLMYSGTGFNLLASIIEKLSGKSYNSYMEERIFRPLGMLHTQVANRPRSGNAITGLANGYVYSDSLKKYVQSETLQTGWTTFLVGINGEGMIITTTGDLLKWDRALKNNSLLAAKTQQEMLSQQSEKKFPKVSFGYGMRVGKNEYGNFIFHNGYYPGYLSMHLRYTDDDITVIVLSNNESHAEYIADALSGIMLNKKILLPYLHTEIKKAEIPNNFTGKYMMMLTRPPYLAVFPIQFLKKDDALYVHTGNGPDIRLQAESGKKFFFSNGTDQQIEFETADNGNLLAVWHIAWGVRRELKKVE